MSPGGKIYLVGAVRGLASEGERAVKAIEELKPDVLAISVSGEGLEAMRGSDQSSEAQATNPEEEVYIAGLSEFGKVMSPPPCFHMPQMFADEKSIPVEALDMDDEHYTAAYCRYVSTMDMIRQGGSGKRLARHPFEAQNPEDFVREWDELVNRLAGYRSLEDAREEWMAKGLVKLGSRHAIVLAVIELERAAGVQDRLRNMGHDCYYMVQ